MSVVGDDRSCKGGSLISPLPKAGKNIQLGGGNAGYVHLYLVPYFFKHPASWEGLKKEKRTEENLLRKAVRKGEEEKKMLGDLTSTTHINSSADSI